MKKIFVGALAAITLILVILVNLPDKKIEQGEVKQMSETPTSGSSSESAHVQVKFTPKFE